MKEKYIVSVSLTLTVEASMASAALLKAAKKFGKYTVDAIDVYNEDGSEACTITHDSAIKRVVRLKEGV